MKKTEDLKQLIEKVNTEKTGAVRLNPAIAPEKVKAFEKKHKISLPKEYAEFVTKIGDGGTIQSEVYGVQRFRGMQMRTKISEKKGISKSDCSPRLRYAII